MKPTGRPPITGERECRLCRCVFPAEAFRWPSGAMRTRCYPCYLIRKNTRARLQYATNPEVAEDSRQKCREYRKANQDVLNIKRRGRYRDNPELYKAQVRRYRAKRNRKHWQLTGHNFSELREKRSQCRTCLAAAQQAAA
jgi:hypothetical protein